jgi:hypothetical protein
LISIISPNLGGNSQESKGMEAWNPDDVTVQTFSDVLWNLDNATIQTLSDVLPPEERKSSGLETSQLIAINDGSELLLFGGWPFNTYAEGGIWKFSMLEKSLKVETSKI